MTTEPETDAEALEAGRKLFARTCDFMKSVVRMDDLPPGDAVEVAFAGRSNVGKSSLLNALTGRKALARTSNTPGRTQALNYFSLADGALWLVDMPGYGFAKVPKHLVEGWTRLIHDYLRGRASLRRLCLLVDARHGLKPADIGLMDGLDKAAVSFQVVLTKIDKISEAQQRRVVDEVEAELKKHAAALPRVLVTSTKKGIGIDVLRAHLADLALDEGRS